MRIIKKARRIATSMPPSPPPLEWKAMYLNV